MSPPRGWSRFLPVLALLTLAAVPPPVGLTPKARLHLGQPQRALMLDGVAWVGLDTGLARFDVTPGSPPALLSHLRTDGRVLDLTATSTHVIAATGASGVALVDRGNPTVLAQVVALSDTTAVAATEDLLAVADGTTLRLLPLPSASTFLSALPLSGSVGALAFHDDTVIVGLGGADPSMAGLVLVDVATPSAPMVLDQSDAADPVHDLLVQGDRLRVAAGRPLAGELGTHDLSTGRFVTVDRLPVPTPVRDLSEHGSTVLLAAAGPLGARSYSLADPDAPVATQRVASPGENWTVAMDSFVGIIGQRSSLGAGGVVGLELDPDGGLATGETFPLSEATDVTHCSGLVLLLDRDRMSVAGWSGSDLVELADFTVEGADFRRIACDGTMAAVAEPGTIHLVDVSDGAAPASVGSIDLVEGQAVDLDLRDDRLLVADGIGLLVLDVSLPGDIRSLAALSTSGWSAGVVATDDDMAYLATGTELVVVEIGPPWGAQVVGSVDLPETAYSLAASGALAAVGGHSETALVDLSDPRRPTLVHRLLGRPGHGVALDRGLLFIAGGETGLSGHDVLVPDSPVTIADYQQPGHELTAVALVEDDVLVVSPTGQHHHLGCQACAITTQRELTITNAIVVDDLCGTPDHVSDGQADPGEWIRIRVSVRNTGSVATPELDAELLAPAGVLLQRDRAFLPALNPGDTTTLDRDFELFLPEVGLACGDDLGLTVRLGSPSWTTEGPVPLALANPCTTCAEVLPGEVPPTVHVSRLDDGSLRFDFEPAPRAVSHAVHVGLFEQLRQGGSTEQACALAGQHPPTATLDSGAVRPESLFFLITGRSSSGLHGPYGDDSTGRRRASSLGACPAGP
ncbi:MAG: hypothetical protein AAF533_27515 [Acidobacteriota bacterium]